MSDRITSNLAPIPTINTPVNTLLNASSSTTVNQQLVETSTSTENPHKTSPCITQPVATEPRIFNQAVPEFSLEITSDLSGSERETMSHTAPEISEQSIGSNSGSAPLTTAAPHKTIYSQALLNDEALGLIQIATQSHSNNDETLSYHLENGDHGAVGGQFQLIQMSEEEDRHARQRLDIVRIRNLAQQGDIEAQFSLALVYQNSEDGILEDVGTTNDAQAKAFYWYLKAAEQGHIDAQFNLAQLYESGEGVKENQGEAVFWFRKAAEKGDVDAMRALFLKYRDGQGVEKDLDLAAYWLLKARPEVDSVAVNLNHSIPSLESILQALTKITEFKQIKILRFRNLELKSENISGLDIFIRSSTPIEAIYFSDIQIQDDATAILAKSLEHNTILTKLIFDTEDVDKKIILRINASLAQNVAIAELRQYMKDHPITRSDALPIEVLDITVDQIIIAYLKNGKSKQETIAAIDAYLLSVSIESLKNDLKKSLKQ